MKKGCDYERHKVLKDYLSCAQKNNARDKAEVVVSGNCVICRKQLDCGRLFICKECELNNTVEVKNGYYKTV